MIGELKNMAAQAAQMSAMQYKERKELLKKELEEDEEIEESRAREMEARAAQAAKEREMKSEARGISYRRRSLRRQLMSDESLPPRLGHHHATSRTTATAVTASAMSEANESNRGDIISGEGGGGGRRSLLAHPSVAALPPMITGAPIATRGFILGMHIRMGVSKKKKEKIERFTHICLLLYALMYILKCLKRHGCFL
jgi:hypothetical protein